MAPAPGTVRGLMAGNKDRKEADAPWRKAPGRRAWGREQMMVPKVRLELTTYALRMRCSTD